MYENILHSSTNNTAITVFPQNTYMVAFMKNSIKSFNFPILHLSLLVKSPIS